MNVSMRGFTLWEMAVTMLIVGVLATVSLPSIFGAIQAFRLNAAARKMTADIRYARELALNRHGTYGIWVNVSSNSYSVFSLSGSTKTTVTDPWLQKLLSVDFDLTPEYSGVQIGTVDLCEGNGCPAVELRFNAFGTPSDSSAVAMASAATIGLQAGGVTKTITIQPETAFCEIS